MNVKQTVFSPCRRYRYSLYREWPMDLFGPETQRGFLQMICLNPSTADENIDDPTVRRCIDYAKRWGYGGFIMTNLFGFRATDPAVMRREASPVDHAGGVNLAWIVSIARQASLIVAAWGRHGAHLGQSKKVMRALSEFHVHCLGVNDDGSPKHPLYLRSDTEPVPFNFITEASETPLEASAL